MKSIFEKSQSFTQKVWDSHTFWLEQRVLCCVFLKTIWLRLIRKVNLRKSDRDWTVKFKDWLKVRNYAKGLISCHVLRLWVNIWQEIDFLLSFSFRATFDFHIGFVILPCMIHFLAATFLANLFWQRRYIAEPSSSVSIQPCKFYQRTSIWIDDEFSGKKSVQFAIKE